MTKYRFHLIAAFVATFALSSAWVCSAQDDASENKLAVSSQTDENGEVRTETPGKVTLEKTLAGDVKVSVVKVGEQPAVATIEIPGKEKVEFDAYEPLETAPEEAREYLDSVWDRLGEKPEKLVNIEIDTSEAPDAAEWARRAQYRVQYWYPKVVKMLDGQDGLDRIPDDFKIRLVFKPIDGVAYAAGREITVSSNYIKRRPDDFGLVIHETTHVAQAYGRVRETWAMEGMTDWIRYYVTEPRTRNHWNVGADVRRQKYTDSYGVTAAFYNWLVENRDPQFIHKIHKTFRVGGSVELLAREEYHKSLQELWDEYVEDVTKK